MRFEASYKLSSHLLPVEYRRGFASLIKEAIKRANPGVFQRYYSRLHVLKPFTFSVYFPGLRGREGDSFDVGERAIVHFSTSAPELGVSVYNGLLALRSYPLFHSTLLLERIHLGRRVVIRDEAAIFKTMAPVLVNNKGDANFNNKDAANWYLLPGQEGFNEGLEFAIKEAARAFLGDPDVSIELTPVRICRKVVRHYNMHMQGFVGVFELRGRPEVLDLIYRVGLGVRRSQGFGMLEMVQMTSRKSIPTEEGIHA